MKRAAETANATRQEGGGAGGSDKPALSLRFWGVRGSIPVSDPEMIDYGGNTPCIEVHAGDHLFVIDAGSGIAPLGRMLRDNGVKKVDILLSHLHHDHVMGLFFFKPFYEKDAEITIYCGNLNGETAEVALRRLFSPPLFPITFDELPAKIRFVGFKAGETLTFADGVSVKTHLLEHPSGSTAYRFEHGGRTAVVVTDVEHRHPGPCHALADFIRGADTIVYDSMLCPNDYPSCRGWGHSTPSEGVTLCKEAGVPQMICFHHHPAYSDKKLHELDVLVDKMLPGSFLAKEGQMVVLGGRQDKARKIGEKAAALS